MVNCEYLATKTQFDTNNVICEENLWKANARDSCLNTALKLKETYKINGETCKFWKTWNPTCSSLGGEWKATCIPILKFMKNLLRV